MSSAKWQPSCLGLDVLMLCASTTAKGCMVPKVDFYVHSLPEDLNIATNVSVISVSTVFLPKVIVNTLRHE